MILPKRHDGTPSMILPPSVPLSADPIAAVLAITCIMAMVVGIKVTFRQFIMKSLG